MISKKTDLLCVGNALIDVFARVDEQFFARHGLNQPVHHIEIEKLEKILSELRDYTAVSGGGAANVAKIAGLLGAKVSFVGTTGNDKFGRLFKKSLAAAGVKLRLSIKTSHTGICLMLRDPAGETRIAASPSAALELSESDISGEELQRAKVVLIDGFMLEETALVSHILSMAGRNDSISTAAIDLSSPGIAREYAAEIADFAKNYPLILFMNEAEIEAFSDGLKIKSVMQETLFEKNTNFPIIVVKMGQDGALCYSGDKIVRAETQAVTPVDATGAGDAFCAGFLSAWVKNKTLGECAAFGNMTARTVLGAEGSQADKKALKSLAVQLKKQRP